MKVIKGLPAEWGMCSRTVLLDRYYIEALSYHNNIIAIGSEHQDILILNAITGSQTAVLSGHTEEVSCLTFSSDGTSLVSGSDDLTVKLWDLQTGGVVKTFSGHTSTVWSVSISPDLATIASGSDNNAICLWNIQTGECYQIIQQQNQVLYVAFSPKDPQHLVSICDEKAWQWDTNGHQIKPPYDGSCIAFSSDGTQLVSCNGAVATVQNSDSGVIVAEFNAADCDVYTCCFSPDGGLVAVAAGNAVYVWDIISPDPHLVESFIGHTADIASLVFSSPSTLISASRDESVKWWKIGALQTDQAVTDPKSTSFTEAQTHITLQAKDGITITISHPAYQTKINLPSISCMSLLGEVSVGIWKDALQTPVEISQIFTVSSGWINFWDVEKGKYLLRVDEPLDVDILKISGDGSRVFCQDRSSIWARSVHTGKIVGKAEPVDLLRYGSLAVDGTRVWAPEDQGWDFGIPGSLPVQLPSVPPHKLHPNCQSAFLWSF